MTLSAPCLKFSPKKLLTGETICGIPCHIALISMGGRLRRRITCRMGNIAEGRPFANGN